MTEITLNIYPFPEVNPAEIRDISTDKFIVFYEWTNFGKYKGKSEEIALYDKERGFFYKEIYKQTGIDYVAIDGVFAFCLMPRAYRYCENKEEE